jgi:hypothetical protein
VLPGSSDIPCSSLSRRPRPSLPVPAANASAKHPAAVSIFPLPGATSTESRPNFSNDRDAVLCLQHVPCSAGPQPRRPGMPSSTSSNARSAPSSPTPRSSHICSCLQQPERGRALRPPSPSPCSAQPRLCFRLAPSPPASAPRIASPSTSTHHQRPSQASISKSP